ncbi:hypothetical protein C1708_08700 [Streptomyces sp. DH-12]|nr:hypothetical protein C1708_08700 [Streptomyces sp. DH-12]
MSGTRAPRRRRRPLRGPGRCARRPWATQGPGTGAGVPGPGQRGGAGRGATRRPARGQTRRRTATTLPRIVASSPGIGS